jgi:23S rRNA (pseudouridine1915-N3)-methyltransferase
MRLRLLAVGTRMPAWVNDGFNEYAGRMPPESRIELVEIPPGRRGKGQPPERAVAEEGDRLLSALRADDRLIVLEVAGRAWSTQALAEQLGNWLMDGRDLALAIGGADGLDGRVLARAERRWSLSPLTLPHGLVRVVVAEQLYRAWSIRAGHPYHRA